MSDVNPVAVESELSVVRRALAARVAQHDDKLAHALLACLHLLAALQDRLTENAGAEALDPALGTAHELAGAARLITFNPLFPALRSGPTAASGDHRKAKSSQQEFQNP